MSKISLFFKSITATLFVSFISFVTGVGVVVYILLDLLLKEIGVEESITPFVVICIGVMGLFFICSTQILAEYYKHKFTEEEQQIKNEMEVERKAVEEIRKNNEELKELIDSTITEKIQMYPWLAEKYADINYIYDKRISEDLKLKNHPALKASESLSKIALEKRELQKMCKLQAYQLNYYETVFPWLEEFKEIDPKVAWEIVSNSNEEEKEEYDSLRNWLSPEEYQSLPSCEKYQLALNRYFSKPKSNWEIGRDFERYVGYLYEQNKYRVNYQGALLGLEDMGRDLICEKGNEVLVIQCKRWAREKIVHEKHIFQLYGSIVVLATQNPSKKVSGIFICTCGISDLAMNCAAYLGITICDNYVYETYPMIKCNISRSNGEKIYHLPFDQQYDKIAIEPERGELYTSTVADAEKRGFRRAWRWHVEKNL